jgi:hypothetical protein
MNRRQVISSIVTRCRLKAGLQAATLLFSVGKWGEPVQVVAMSGNAQPDKLASFLAEEILRTIYGDDYRGCTVSPDEIAKIILKGLQQAQTHTNELVELYEKVVEAVDLLTTPPDPGKVTDPEQLRRLLSERLDGIHALTTKTIQTTALVRRAAKTDE